MCDELYDAAVYVLLQERNRNREKRLLGTPLLRAALGNDWKLDQNAPFTERTLGKG